MKIEIGVLNAKSISTAIKKLQKVQKSFPKMVEQLLNRSRLWIMQRANENIDRSDIGSNIKNTIKSQWRLTEIVDGTCKLINEDSFGNGENKAVFVEFGIGVVGGSKPHPEAFANGYEYNVPSDFKGMHEDTDEWSFFSNEEDLDIPQTAITKSFSLKGSIRSSYRTKKGEVHTYKDTRDRYLVYTKGTQGVLFLYNALVDFKSQGQAKSIWQAICKEYLG